MSGHRYCIHCQDYYPPESFADHMKQHTQFLNSDAVEHKQYSGTKRAGTEDYMICTLHQKKCPCPVKGCKYFPFGMIKKGFISGHGFKGLIDEIDLGLDVVSRHANDDTKAGFLQSLEEGAEHLPFPAAVGFH